MTDKTASTHVIQRKIPTLDNHDYIRNLRVISKPMTRFRSPILSRELLNLRNAFQGIKNA